ncbi:hypothetical protein MY10362_006862, partial [Beauveria mimosiformis]
MAILSNNSGADATINNKEHSPETQTPSSTPVRTPRPPDGGLTAWLQVLAGHLIVFNTWGYIISFGIFQPYYEQQLALDPSAVSWIDSVQICLVLLVGAFSGRLFDAGYFGQMLVVGALVQLVGIFAASAATRYLLKPWIEHAVWATTA